MTVSSQQNEVTYVGDGSTVSFPIPFYFLQNTDINVIVSDSDSNIYPVVQNVDYTVTGAGNQAGGTVVFGVAPVSLRSILVQRVVPSTQLTDYQPNDDFPADTHERALDKLTMITQQQKSLLARALLRPFGRQYYDAENRNISNMKDPILDQDGATKGWAGRFFGDLIDGATGLINTTMGILYDAGTLYDYLRDNLDRRVPNIAGLRVLNSARNKQAATLGFYNRWDGGHAKYIVDETDTTSAEAIPFIIKADDNARWKLVHDGEVTAEQCGLKRDGTTNTQMVLDALMPRLVANNARLVWGYGTYMCEHITLIPNLIWIGKSQWLSILKAKNALNQDFITSSFAANVNNVTLRKLQIHGNRANNTTGTSFALKGAKQELSQVVITQSAGTGFVSDFDIIDGERALGFESSWTDIVIDSTGGSAWLYNGPTDSSINNLTIIDAGLLADNTYYGFRATRNYRGNNIHTWNRGGTTNTPSAMMQIEASAPGCTGVNCHFEGGHTPLKVFASSCSFSACDYYATRGPYCVENYGLANQFHGVLGATSAAINPDYNGFLCAGGNSRIDLIDVGCRTGAIDFTGSQGGNSVVINGWRATGIPYFGTPAASDDVNLLIGGPGGGQLVQQRRNPMKAVGYTVAAASGTLTNATATGAFIDRGSMIECTIVITIVTNGTGATALNVTVPWVATRTMSIFGYEDVTGKAVRGTIQSGTSVFRVVDYNNAYAGANGMTLRLNGEIERN